MFGSTCLGSNIFQRIFRYDTKYPNTIWTCLDGTIGAINLINFFYEHSSNTLITKFRYAYKDGNSQLIIAAISEKYSACSEK